MANIDLARRAEIGRERRDAPFLWGAVTSMADLSFELGLRRRAPNGPGLDCRCLDMAGDRPLGSVRFCNMRQTISDSGVLKEVSTIPLSKQFPGRTWSRGRSGQRSRGSGCACRPAILLTLHADRQSQTHAMA